MVDEEFEDENTDKQAKNSRITPLLPFQWKKGQSGNPAGRPKGKTMKEYARDLLSCQTEDERQEFMNGLSKDIIWKMAEGNPDNKIEVPLMDKVNLSPEALALALEYEERLKNKNATRPDINNSLDNQ